MTDYSSKLRPSTPFLGDTGSGGEAGSVPAPASGDATNFLRGDASWGPATGSPAPDYVEEESASSRTSTSFTQKLRLDFTSPSDGTLYLIDWQAEIRNDNPNTPTRIRVELNDDSGDRIADIGQNSEDEGGNRWTLVSGFRRMTADAGDHEVDLDYASGESGKRSRIRRVRIKAQRIL